MRKTFVRCSCALIFVLAAWGAPILPTSYTGPNGGTGFFTYYDDSYSGVGSTTTPYATLSGGTGQLTDGATVTTNWFENAAPWVGWLVIPFDLSGNRCLVGVDPNCHPGLGENPRFTFLFGASQPFGTLSVHVDDSNGFGGVRPPLAVEVLGETAGVFTYSKLFNLVDPVTSDPKWYDLDVTGLSTDRVIVRLLYRDAWIFADEIRFDSAVVGGAISGVTVSAPVTNSPEPGSMVLLSLGLAGVTLLRRKRA
ncbi:MAG: PEP-CTERM sorting domain-containing protein [Bryobacteraceae bacterium]